jgi:hypothetical protein
LKQHLLKVALKGAELVPGAELAPLRDRGRSITSHASICWPKR